MGLYIDPKEGSKELWLRQKGEGPLYTIPKVYKEGTKFVVCLIENFGFSTAGVMFSQKELEEFSDAKDFRPKLWFLIEEADIKEVCGKEANYYLGKQAE